MKIYNNEKHSLLQRLPDVKLSYENIHKKVLSDLYYLIPKGRKHLVWFTYFKDKKVCIFLDIKPGTKKFINDIFIIPQIFEKKIVLGTIFYGTLFTVNKRKYFSIENIHYYKGKNIQDKDELFKLKLINEILKTEIKPCILTENGVAFGLPLIENDYKNALRIAKNNIYPIYSIQSRNLHSNNNLYSSTLFKNFDIDEEKLIFSIKADVQNDIYFLYYKNDHHELEKYQIAAIPDFKTSTLMNNIFRNIKENKNLDALEESDDEEEFENINEDKFVDLEKSVCMECVYNKHLKKYVPIKINNNGSIVNKKDIKK